LRTTRKRGDPRPCEENVSQEKPGLGRKDAERNVQKGPSPIGVLSSELINRVKGGPGGAWKEKFVVERKGPTL